MANSEANFATRLVALATYTSIFLSTSFATLFHLNKPTTPTPTPPFNRSGSFQSPVSSRKSSSSSTSSSLPSTPSPTPSNPLPGTLSGLCRVHGDTLRNYEFCIILFSLLKNRPSLSSLLPMVQEALAIEKEFSSNLLNSIMNPFSTQSPNIISKDSTLTEGVEGKKSLDSKGTTQLDGNEVNVTSSLRSQTLEEPTLEGLSLEEKISSKVQMITTPQVPQLNGNIISTPFLEGYVDSLGERIFRGFGYTVTLKEIQGDLFKSNPELDIDLTPSKSNLNLNVNEGFGKDSFSSGNLGYRGVRGGTGGGENFIGNGRLDSTPSMDFEWLKKVVANELSKADLNQFGGESGSLTVERLVGPGQGGTDKGRSSGSRSRGLGSSESLVSTSFSSSSSSTSLSTSTITSPSSSTPSLSSSSNSLPPPPSSLNLTSSNLNQTGSPFSFTSMGKKDSDSGPNLFTMDAEF